MAKTISAVIIAKNEQDRIQKAIDSLAFVDEIVVVDNGSSDATSAIAKKNNVRVISSSQSSFADLRNIGKKEVSGLWILYLDADEIVPPPLAKEIQTIIINTTFVCYFIRRNNYYLGTQWPTQDRMQRLFLRESLVNWHGDLHETPKVRGETSELVHALDHHTHRTLEEMLAKTIEWSKVEALLRFNAGHPPVAPWRLLRVFLTGFFQTYVNGGWRAGTVGMIESMYQGFSLFITYAKLWELQQKYNK